MTALEGKIREAIFRYNMLPAGTHLGVAVSGGADSMCLLHVMHAIHEPLSVIHVNHRLRGAESDADEAFVRDEAARLDLPIRVTAVDLPEQGNLEEMARDARRRVFSGLIGDSVVDRVALAHTRSDQAETVLFRLLRGAYTTGLAGMRPVTTDGLVRPLLEVTRTEVTGWLLEKGIAWREDSSNQDPRFARNRIRNSLLPLLENEWNPSLGEILANHSRLAQEDEDYWENAIVPWRTCKDPNGNIIVDLTKFPTEMALRRRVVRDTIRRVKRDLRQIDFRHIEQVLILASEGDGHGRLQIPGVDVMRSFELMRFAVPQDGPVERDWSREGRVPAVLSLPDGESEVVVEVLNGQPDTGPRDTLLAEGFDWDLAASRVQSGIVLRNWRPGDRYRRRGHVHEDKVKSMFHEARIPLWERRDWPMVCVEDQILWSRRFGPTDWCAATAASGSILRIFERKSNRGAATERQ